MSLYDRSINEIVAVCYMIEWFQMFWNYSLGEHYWQRTTLANKRAYEHASPQSCAGAILKHHGSYLKEFNKAYKFNGRLYFTGTGRECLFL